MKCIWGLYVSRTAPFSLWPLRASSRCWGGSRPEPPSRTRGSGTGGQQGESPHRTTAVTQSPGRGGRERARRVPRATVGTIPPIFVKPSPASRRFNLFLFFFFFFPLESPPFFFPVVLPSLQLRGAAARHATPAQMQHPTPPQARCGAGCALPQLGEGEKAGHTHTRNPTREISPLTVTSCWEAARVRQAVFTVKLSNRGKNKGGGREVEAP